MEGYALGKLIGRQQVYPGFSMQQAIPALNYKHMYAQYPWEAKERILQSWEAALYGSSLLDC